MPDGSGDPWSALEIVRQHVTWDAVVVVERGFGALDRIRIDPTHIVGWIDPVNPVYIYKVEQIHAVDGIAGGDSHQPRSALEPAAAREKHKNGALDA